jgi:hypothetical protein
MSGTLSVILVFIGVAEAEPRPPGVAEDSITTPNRCECGARLLSNASFTFTTLRRDTSAAHWCQQRPPSTASRHRSERQCQRLPSCCVWCTFRYASKCMQCMAVNISHHSLPSPLYALVSSTTDTDRVASGVWPTPAAAVAGRVTPCPSPALTNRSENRLKTFATFHASPTRQRSTLCLERCRR